MSENTMLLGFSLGAMLPLDMLAEVATKTLKNDPSLKRNSSYPKPQNHCSKVCNAKRSASNGDVLNLDQIRHLSDKMLLEMFSESSSDEIRKNFSYQCFLMPDKCAKTFSSFGNETKARLQIKSHLACHISQLISEKKDPSNHNKPFVAQPIYIRQKKLQESATKKRKKNNKVLKKTTKNEPPKPVMEKKILNLKSKPTKEIESNLDKEVASRPSVKKQSKPQNNKHLTRFRKTLRVKMPRAVRMEKENQERNPSSAFDELCSAIQKVDNGYNQNLQDDLDKMSNYKNFFKSLDLKECNKDNSSIEKDCETNDTKEENHDNKSAGNETGSTSEASPAVKPLEQLVQFQSHDHTYTSTNGKTYNLDPNIIGDANKTVTKPVKERRRFSHKCTGIAPHFIIPTPPFPYLYIPILPHIAEISEVGGTTRRTCEKCSHKRTVRPVPKQPTSNKNTSQNSTSPQVFKPNIRLRRYNKLIIPEEYETDEDEDENFPLTFPENFADDNRIPETDPSEESTAKNTTTGSKLMQQMYGENSQAVEKKLALKCIRALRTKKKDERGPLVCQICKDKSFTAQATLMYHYRSHAGIKPFSCSVCDATFTRQHSLNYHMLIHNNKSRFVCLDCGRNFRHPSHYKEHLRRHTGETPYQCMDCSLRFKTRNTYKRHLKTRHGKILTARGIRILSLEEFNKVRTSPRKRSNKPHLHRTPQHQWSGITFSTAIDAPKVKIEPLDD